MSDAVLPTPSLTVLRPWHAPKVLELPKLSALTLASPIGGGGGTGGGGSTVFGLLLALISLGLAACSGPEATTPSDRPPVSVSQVVTCRGSTITGTVDCAGPQAATAIVGGQGGVIALRSSNVSYDSVAEVFQFDVTLQNLGTQTLGSNGTGINVFFESGPTVTGGTGTASVANADGTGTFSAADQPYFLYSDSLKSGVTSSAKTWELSISNTVTTFTFTVLVSTWLHDETGVLSWTRVPGLSNATYTDIAVNSATDAMVVGMNGVVLRKVGTQWSSLPKQVNENWVGVEPIGNGQYIGATNAGRVYRFDGRVWHQLRDVGYAIEALTAYAADRIAVSAYNNMDWLGDNGWQHATMPAEDFRFLGTWDIDNAIVMSVEGTQILFSYNTTVIGTGDWEGVPRTAIFSGIGRGSGYGTYTAPQGRIHRVGGGVIWGAAVDTMVDALEHGANGLDVMAAVRDVNTGGSSLWSFTGGVWGMLTAVPDTVIAMKQDSAGGYYLLSAGGLRHWDGATLEGQFATGYPTSVSATGSVAFVGTSGGDVWRYDGSNWTSWSLGAFGIDFIATAGSNAAAAVTGEGRIWVFDGAAWTDLGTWATPFSGVASFGPNTAATAGGFGGTNGRLVVRVDNGSTSPDALLSVPYWRGIWGDASSNFWVVAGKGTVHRFNGFGYENNSLSDTTRTLTAVTGLSASDVWVGDSAGAVFHWDGGSWSSCYGMTSGPITRLWAHEAGTVYAAVSSAGGVYRVTNGCTSRWIPIDSTAGQVTGLTGSSADQAWAIVGGNLYRGRR